MDITKQTPRSGKGARNAARLDEHAGMTKTAGKRRIRDATLGGMDDKNFLPQTQVAEPETSQERIAKIKAAVAVQIAQAAAGQPSKWTVIREVTHWVMARLDQLLGQTDQLPPLS